MSDKSDAFGIIRTCFGKYPPNWVTPDDYGLEHWRDIGCLNGEEIRYKTQELTWVDQGYPLRHNCKRYGSNSLATETFFESKHSKTPGVFFCRWCKSIWSTDRVDEKRLLEVKVALGLEKQEALEKYLKENH